MKNNSYSLWESRKKAETLVSLMVGVFLLSIIILGAASILVINKDIEINYGRTNDMAIMRLNAGNILRKLDTSGLKEKEYFYIQKDSVSKRFIIHTGSTGENYRYIDRLGNNIDKNKKDTKIYSRLFFVTKQGSLNSNESEVIRGSIRELIRK